MNRIITFVIIVAGIINSAGADTDLSRADSLYEGGQYMEALQLYEQAARLDGTSAELLYNTGNAAVKANRYGTAMVAYQRAAALDPGNSRIRHNIKYLKGKIDDRNTAKLGGRKGDMNHQENSALGSLWLGITAQTSPDLWGWLALASFVLLLAGSLSYLLGRNVVLRKSGFFTAIICIGLTVVFNVFAISAKAHWNNMNECVVTAFETTPLPSPDKDVKSGLTPLVAGTLLAMPPTETKAPEGWVYVRLNASVAGWVPASDITIL